MRARAGRSAGPAPTWAAGPAGRILHRPAGGAWTEVDQGATSQLSYRDRRRLRRRCGRGRRASQRRDLDARHHAGSGHRAARRVAARRNGASWLGGLGTLLHYDGATWTSSTYGGVMAMTGLPNGDGWLATQTTVAHFDGSSWMDLGVPPRQSEFDLGERGQRRVGRGHCATARRSRRCVTGMRRHGRVSDGISDDLFQISGVPGGVVYAVGGANVVRYDVPGQWTQVTGLPAGNTWGSVAVVSATDVYLAATTLCGVAHYDGAQWDDARDRQHAAGVTVASATSLGPLGPRPRRLDPLIARPSSREGLRDHATVSASGR